jgi:hypothetical protein
LQLTFPAASIGPDLELQSRNERDVHDIVRAVRLENHNLSAGRIQRYKVFMLDRNTSSIREMNPKWTKGLGM